MGISKLSLTMKPERWELIFYILGGATCIRAFADSFRLPDSPSSAHFLNQRECVIAVKELRAMTWVIKNKAFNKSQIKLSFLDRKTILVFVSVFAVAIPNGVVDSFSAVIIYDLGFTITMTT
jgi:hypothetical protein